MAKQSKKPAAKKAVKPAPKKAPAVPIKANPAPAPAAKPAAAKPAKSSATMEKPSKKNALRDSILKRKAPAKPIAFSLDEVRAIAKTVTSKTNTPFPTKAGKGGAAKAVPTLEKPAKPSHHKA